MVVPSTDVDAVMSRMPPELQSHATSLTPALEAELIPATTLFSTPTLLAKHRADFQLYMEASLAYSKLGVGKILVTDDHRFFIIFCSPTLLKMHYTQCV